VEGEVTIILRLKLDNILITEHPKIVEMIKESIPYRI